MASSPIRLLVFDDEESIHETAEINRLELDVEVDILPARTLVEAAELYRGHYFDVVLIDLVGSDGGLAGLELLRFLRQLKSRTDVVLMTHLDLQLKYANVMMAVASADHPHVVRFIDKRHSSNFVGDAIEHTQARLSAANCSIERLDLVAELIADRRTRFGATSALPLRSEKSEIGLEVERLAVSLFGSIPSGGDRRTAISVRFEPLERLGLSAAVVVRALVSLGSESVTSSEPYECVVKFGPREELREEASRYLEVVRFGVRLEEKVELLGMASGDSLGAVVYSMAGGTQGTTRSLDELLAEEPNLAAEVIRRLFSNANWYGVDAGRKAPREFFRQVRRTDFVDAFDNSGVPNEKACRWAGGELRNGPNNPSIRVNGGLEFGIPGRDYTGKGSMLMPRPWCLVHGDMHGGNVMAELTDDSGVRTMRRVSLIDYRQSGPGPRCVDAAAIECAIRMADARAISSDERHADDPRLGGRVALMRQKDERALLDKNWRPSTDLARKYPFERCGDWLSQSLEVARGAARVFTDSARGIRPVSDKEYIDTCILYCLGQLRYPMREVVRLRLLSWLGALFDYSEENVDEVTMGELGGEES